MSIKDQNNIWYSSIRYIIGNYYYQIRVNCIFMYLESKSQKM